MRLWPTSRPSGNLFYDAAVRSMGLSWHNFFFGAIEPGGSVSIDKPPGDLWLQVASTKVLGFTTFALHLPEAVAGSVAVGMLYCLVRSVWGPLAGGLAGFALAVLPISVLTSRSDTMDSVMMALLVAALWASVRGLQTHRWTWIVGAAGLVGVAFNVKLAQALIPLPGLAVMWLAAGRGRGRIPILIGAAVTLVVVSMSWITIASLTPAGQRPYPVGSGTGSIYRVVFVFNGLDRIRGSSPQLGSSDPTRPGPLRLVSAGADYSQLIGVELATAIALLLAVAVAVAVAVAAPAAPAAAAAAAAGRIGAEGRLDRSPGDGALRAGAPREAGDRLRVARWTGVGLGVWLVTAVGLLSGIRQLQTRYLETASPAIAAVVGVCAAGLIDRAVRGDRRRESRWALAAGLVVSGLYGVGAATDGLGQAAGGAAIAGGVVMALWAGAKARAGSPAGARGRLRAGAGAGAGGRSAADSAVGRWRPGVVGVGVVVGLGVLAMPLRVSVDTIARGSSDATHGGSGAQYAAYLRAHRAGARYEAASGDTLGVVGLIAADAQPVLILEDVKGPLVRLARLEALVRGGAVRYVLIAHPCSHGRRCPSAISWSMRHAVRVRGYMYAYTASSRVSAGRRVSAGAGAAPLGGGSRGIGSTTSPGGPREAVGRRRV